MPHLVHKVKFATSKSQQWAAYKNMCVDLITHKYVTTTKARAKAIKAHVDRIISRYDDTLLAKRYTEKLLGNHRLAGYLKEIKEKAKKSVKGGYIELYNLTRRKGDNAEMVKLMISGFEISKRKGLKTKSDLEAEKAEKQSSSGLDFLRGKKHETSEGSLRKGQAGKVVEKTKAKSRSGI